METRTSIGRQGIEETRHGGRQNQSKRATGENPKITILRKREQKCPKCGHNKAIKYETTGQTKCTKCGHKEKR